MPETDGHPVNNENSDSEPVQINGENKLESNGQTNLDLSAGSHIASPEKTKNDQIHLNASTSQPPPQQSPLMQPLMNMPMQGQGPPAQMQTQFNTPPPFASFGMPPPNYMYPPNPWTMPWQQPMSQQMGNNKSQIIDPQVFPKILPVLMHII